MQNDESSLLVVMPTYNESAMLAQLVGRVHHAVPSAHILIVDDASPDGTGRIADQLASADSRVRVLHRASKQGLGTAYRSGFEVGLRRGYSYLAELDSDGSHDPVNLVTMVAHAKNGSDLVIGSRWIPGGSIANWSRFRQLISRAGNTYARVMLRSRVRDMTAGLRVYHADIVRDIHLATMSSNGFAFQVEMTWRVEQLRGRITEVPITFVEREGGTSKMGWRIVVEALWRIGLWGLRIRVPFLSVRRF